MKESDEKYKQFQKTYADQKRHTIKSSIKCGDPVLVKNQTRNKMDPLYHPERHVVIQRKGEMIVASDGKKTVTRNTSFTQALLLESETKDHMQSVQDEIEDTVDQFQFTDIGNESTEVVPSSSKTPGVLRRSSRHTTQPMYIEDCVLRNVKYRIYIPLYD